jgi:O-antigen/teichoic acid export membrane protein
MTNPKKPKSLKERLLRSAAGSFGIHITSTALNFLVSIVLARLLNTEGFGIYSYAIAWVSLLSIPANLGLDKLLVREVAVYKTKSDWGLMGGILKWSNLVVLSISIVLAILTALMAWGIKGNNQMFIPLCIALVTLPLTALRNLRLSAMKGLHQVVKSLIPEMIIGPILLLILTGLSYLFHPEKIAPTWLLTLYLISTIITFILGAFWLFQALPKELKTVPSNYTIKPWLGSAFPLMFIGAMQIINARTDIIMLGAMKGSESVGLYVVVNRGVQLIIFSQMAVNTVLAPTIASLYAEGKREKLQRIVTKCSQGVLAISLLVTAALIIFGKWFLGIFGSDFSQAYTALVILSIANLINAGSGSVGFLLSMTEHERFLAITIATTAALNVLLNFLLIPIWGINGAAVATGISMITRNIMNLIWVRLRLGVNSTAFGKIN